MYIKVTTAQTKKKLYRYVKLARARWNGNGSEEKIIATLGTVEEVIKSRDTIIRGLAGLATESLSRLSGQKKRLVPAGRPRAMAAVLHQTKQRSGSLSRVKRSRRAFRGKHKKRATL